jgi:hypothetical protein
VLQALTQAYSATATAATGGADPLTALAGASDNGADPLAALAGASAVGPLVSSITTITQAANQVNGSTTSAAGIPGVQFAPTFGGLDVNSATSLLASLGSSGNTAGLQGFDAAASGAVNLAISAYQAQQAYPAGAPAAVNATPAVGTTNAPTAVPAPVSTQPAEQNPASPAYLQQAAAAVTSPTILSLLA